MPEKKSPCLYIIAGPNGAGKSLNSEKLLPPGLPSFDFDKTVLAFYDSDKSDHELKFDFAYKKATDLFKKEITKAIENYSDFAYETNFFTDNCMHWPNKFKAKRFKTKILFLALQDIDISKRRVDIRVKMKGHFVPEKQIEERYKGSLNKANKHFKNFDSFTLIDATGKSIKPILSIENGKVTSIVKLIPDYLKDLFKPIFKEVNKQLDKDKGISL